MHSQSTLSTTEGRTLTNSQGGIQTFEHEQLGLVRTTSVDGEIWFVLVDVCRALGLGNPSRVASTLDDDEKSTLTISKGGPEANIINESGLYKLIFKSRKESAKVFQTWVTKEVLPSIRRNGGYIMGQEQDTPEVVMAKALQVANNVLNQRTQELQAANDKVENLEQQFASGVTAPDFAKQLNGVNSTQVNHFLCSKGWLIRTNNEWRVASKARDKYMTETIRQYPHPISGIDCQSHACLLTEKGAKRFYDYYLKGELPMKRTWDNKFHHQLQKAG